MHDVIRDYELIFIAVPQLDDEGVAALNERITGRIAAANGTVTKTNVWGRRNLAYPIGKQTEGIYVQFGFQAPPTAQSELERDLQLEEQVIRHLAIRLDEE